VLSLVEAFLCCFAGTCATSGEVGAAGRVSRFASSNLGVFVMVSTPVRSWGRPTAVVSGAAVVVGLAGAWLTPTSADTARPASLGSGSAAAVSVRLVADVRPMVSVWPAAGLGGGPGGGGSDGSGGDAVAPSPVRHGSESGSSSSSSGGAVSRHVSSSEGPGPVQTAFNTVGRWLGFSRHSSAGNSSSQGSEHDSPAEAPKPAKHAAGGGSGSGGSGGGSDSAPSASGVGDLVHSVLSGVGRLIGGLFGH